MRPRFKMIGVIGGMGPLATLNFERKLFLHIQATKDQDFPQVISFNNSQIPDRTAALLGLGPSPVPELVKTARALISSGAEILCLPCNTSHVWLGQIQAQIDMPIVNMVDEVCNEAARIGVQRIGLLATTGTVRSGLYLKALKQRGIGLLNVPQQMQNNTMDAIYGIKKGQLDRPWTLLNQAIKWLVTHGSQAVILGCTELPLVLQDYEVPMVDSANVLAKSVVKQADRKISDIEYMEKYVV